MTRLIWSPEPKPPEQRPRKLDWLDWLIVFAIIVVLWSSTGCYRQRDYACHYVVGDSVVAVDTVDVLPCPPSPTEP